MEKLFQVVVKKYQQLNGAMTALAARCSSWNTPKVQVIVLVVLVLIAGVVIA